MSGIEKSIWIDAPIETVFDYFTVSEKLQSWCSLGAKVEPRVGGAYQIDMGVAGIIDGVVTAIEAPTFLSYEIQPPPALQAGSSTVTIRLTEEAGGTRVNLEHSGLTDPFPAIATKGWDYHFARLSVVCNGGTPGPDTLCTRPMESLLESE